MMSSVGFRKLQIDGRHGTDDRAAVGAGYLHKNSWDVLMLHVNTSAWLRQVDNNTSPGLCCQHIGKEHGCVGKRNNVKEIMAFESVQSAARVCHARDRGCGAGDHCRGRRRLLRQVFEFFVVYIEKSFEKKGEIYQISRYPLAKTMVCAQLMP